MLAPPLRLALYKSDGALDKKFGSSGTVVDTSLNTSTSSPNSLGGTTTVYQFFQPAGAALKSDGSILIAGTYVTDTNVTTSSGSYSWTTNERELALVHYLATGERDMSFGSDGIAITPITPTGVASSNAGGSNIAIQPNGAIVEVGTATGSNGYNDVVLARYNSNGTLDPTFGGIGYALVDLGVASSGDSVVVEPDGEVAAAGLVVTSFYPGPQGAPLTWAFATVGLTSAGLLDPTFGSGGVTVTQVLYDDLYSVTAATETINNQTMIVDAGTAQASGSNSQDFALARYNSTGSLDSAAPETLGVTNSGRAAGLDLTKNATGATVAAAVGTTAPDPFLAPLVLDSPDLWDSLAVKKHARSV